jgi:polyisoprenoid-binding protein YceI
MKTIARTLLVAFALATGPAFAGELRGTLDVAFTGASTLHDFGGWANEIPYVARSQASDGCWGAEITVPVAALQTGNGLRDRNMRSMFEAEKHPLIVAVIRDLDPQRLEEAGGPREIPLDLTIRDRTKPVRAIVSNWHRDDSGVSFDASFNVSLRDFDLEPPSVLFVEVANDVAVAIHVIGVEAHDTAKPSARSTAIGGGWSGTGIQYSHRLSESTRPEQRKPG